MAGGLQVDKSEKSAKSDNQTYLSFRHSDFSDYSDLSMTIKLILDILITTLSVTIVGLILLQPKGVGLSRSFSGFGGFYRSKRGLEKLIFVLTIIFSLAFVIVLLAKLYFR